MGYTVRGCGLIDPGRTEKYKKKSVPESYESGNIIKFSVIKLEMQGLRGINISNPLFFYFYFFLLSLGLDPNPHLREVDLKRDKEALG